MAQSQLKYELRPRTIRNCGSELFYSCWNLCGFLHLLLYPAQVKRQGKLRDELITEVVDNMYDRQEKREQCRRNIQEKNTKSKGAMDNFSAQI